MLSKVARQVSPSPTLAISALANEMKAKGVDVIGFGAGEPDFGTPTHIKKAAVKALEEEFTKYTPVPGISELREAVCRRLSKDLGLRYQPQEIVISNGAKHSLSNAFAAILNPGDEVIIPSPYWVTYPEIVKIYHGVPVIVETTEKSGFKLNRDLLSAKVTPKTKALILNSPSNPTGQVYTRQELEGVADFAKEQNIYVIADEIYEELIYEGEHVSIASLGDAIRELTIIINGVSKSYSMTGWRIGYSASSASIAKIMSSIQSHQTSNANSFAQKGAYAALIGPQECVEEMRRTFAQRRDYMVRRLKEAPLLSCLKPSGAFYVFVNVEKATGKTSRGKVINNGDDFATYLLEDFAVAVVPGSGFGASQHIRLSYATSLENIERGMDRILQFVQELQ